MNGDSFSSSVGPQSGFAKTLYGQYNNCRTVGVLAFLCAGFSFLCLFMSWIEISVGTEDSPFYYGEYYYWGLWEIGDADGYLGAIESASGTVGNLQSVAYAAAVVITGLFVLSIAIGLLEMLRPPYAKDGTPREMAGEAKKFFLWSGIMMLVVTVLALVVLVVFISDDLFTYYYNGSASGEYLYPYASTGPVLAGLALTLALILYIIMIILASKDSSKAQALAEGPGAYYGAPGFPAPDYQQGPAGGQDWSQGSYGEGSGTGTSGSAGTYSSDAVRYCPNCGVQLSPGISFCPNCGHRL